MDRQWRPSPRAIQGNTCPTCSISHLPFCPPQPPTTSSTYHPQPFQGDHHSFQTSPFTRPVPFPNWPPYQQPNGNYLGDGDRNFKRPRIDDYQNPPPLNFSEDERRLKLIRDHGAALANPPQPQEIHHSYVRPQHNQNGFRSDSGHDAFPNGQFNTSSYPFHGYGTNNLDPLQRVPGVSSGFYHARTPQQLGPDYSHGEMNAPYHDFRPSSNVAVPAHEETQHNLNGRGFHYPYPYPGESIGQMESSRFFRGQPPLPTSPPPPLPMDPPINQSSHLKTYFSPPQKQPSLFPVRASSSAAATEAHPVPQPYFHSKPLPEFSTGFHLEV